jgi:hypothetical protein
VALKLKAPILRGLADAVLNFEQIAKELPEPTWHTVGAAGEPGFQNAWVSAAGLAFDDPQFRKLADGRVQVRGAVKNGTNNAVVFTLPAGYAPKKDVMFITQGFAAADTFVRVRVKSNGDVVVNMAATPTAEAHIGPAIFGVD